MAIYVDDFLWAGTSSFEKCVIRELRAKFLIGNTASKSFKYVGLNIISTREGITVDQLQYASSLQPITISRARAADKTSELSQSERDECRGVAGQLHWLTANTRPDLAYDTCEHSGSLKNATIEDLLKLNKLVERVTKDCKITLPEDGGNGVMSYRVLHGCSFHESKGLRITRRNNYISERQLRSKVSVVLEVEENSESG